METAGKKAAGQAEESGLFRLESFKEFSVLLKPVHRQEFSLLTTSSWATLTDYRSTALDVSSLNKSIMAIIMSKERMKPANSGVCSSG